MAWGRPSALTRFIETSFDAAWATPHDIAPINTNQLYNFMVPPGPIEKSLEYRTEHLSAALLTHYDTMNFSLGS
jgi:hypothetical protein